MKFTCPACKAEFPAYECNTYRGGQPDAPIMVECPQCREDFEKPPMKKTTESPTKSPRPITLSHWLCNGGIDPLIRSYDTLVRVAADLPDCEFGWPSLAEALRHICIELEATCWPWEKIHASLTEFEKRELFRRFLAQRDTPGWRRGPERLPGIWTTAQYIAKHGGRNASAECRDFADLLQCLELAGGVNNFYPRAVASQFQSFHRLGFLNDNNPNNWRSAFTYTYGSDGPTILVSCRGAGGLTTRVCLDSTHWCEYSLDDFQGECTQLARSIQADESYLISDDTWRFWWD